jgi:hypothetical protein
MSNLPFLLLILLLIAVAPAADIIPTTFDPLEGLLWGLFAYALTLAFIALLCYYFKSKRLGRSLEAQRVVNIALVVFMFLFCFVFKSIRFEEDSATLSVLLPLALYFFGLAFFYILMKPANSSARSELYFLIPFALPLLCLNLIADVSSVFDFGFNAEDHWNPYTLAIMLCAILLFFAALMLFMPYIIQTLWQCEPLKDRKSVV